MNSDTAWYLGIVAGACGTHSLNGFIDGKTSAGIITACITLLISFYALQRMGGDW